jgi:sulfur-carrier protein
VAKVTVQYYAAAAAAAGITQEARDATTLAELIKDLGARHGAKLTGVLTASTFLIDGLATRDNASALFDG